MIWGTENQVRISRFCLSAAFVGLLYGSGFSVEMPSPLAHWRLNESHGAVAMDSAGTFDGILNGDAEWEPQEGRLGGAIELEGTGDYIRCPNDTVFDITGAITLSAWVKSTNTYSKKTILAKHDVAWRMRLRNGYFELVLPGLSGEQWFTVSGGFVSDDQWHHVAGVFDGISEARVYIDGDMDNSREALGALQTNQWPVDIGRNALWTESPDNRDFKGLIDDVRIYNLALNPDQIAFLAHPTFHVDQATGHDDNEGTSRELAFETIWKGIQACRDQDTLLVWPGLYQSGSQECINFQNKAILVQSAADAAILESPNNFAVVFQSAEQNTSILQNFVIRNSLGGILCTNSSPTIRHVTVAGNEAGIDAYGSSTPLIRNSIFWDNTYDMYHYNSPPFDFDVRFSCTQQGAAGEGNISENPLFADPDHPNPTLRDYHLRSERGRFMPDFPGSEVGIWVLDEETSPCVDAGDPSVNPMVERMPNGGCINMGAYGRTFYAGMSEWPLKGDNNSDGVVNMMDFVILSREWLEMLPWVE